MQPFLEPTVVKGYQCSDFDSIGTPIPPLLVPDTFHNKHLGREQKLNYEPTVDEARSHYTYLQGFDRDRARGYVTGAFYKNIFPGYHTLDASLTGDIDFKIECSLPDGVHRQQLLKKGVVSLEAGGETKKKTMETIFVIDRKDDGHCGILNLEQV